MIYRTALELAISDSSHTGSGSRLLNSFRKAKLLLNDQEDGEEGNGSTVAELLLSALEAAAWQHSFPFLRLSRAACCLLNAE